MNRDLDVSSPLSLLTPPTRLRLRHSSLEDVLKPPLRTPRDSKSALDRIKSSKVILFVEELRVISIL